MRLFLLPLLALAACLPTPPGAAQAEGRRLFNGRDLTDWDGDPRFWSVRDGALTGETTPDRPTPQNTFLIWKGGTLKDFDLSISWRVSRGNSGVQYRSRHLGNWVVAGYQADLEDGDTWTGVLYEERGRGVLAGLGEQNVIEPGGLIQVVAALGEPPAIRAAARRGDWNTYRIVGQGPRLRQWLNGVPTAEIRDDDTERRALEGILALQLHQGPPMTVQFKDVVLKAP